MTDARAKAIEAAVTRFALEHQRAPNEVTPWSEIRHQAVYWAVQDYLATMAEAGWVMVEVPKEMYECDPFDYGWNACRAAMLKGDE